GIRAVDAAGIAVKTVDGQKALGLRYADEKHKYDFSYGYYEINMNDLMANESQALGTSYGNNSYTSVYSGINPLTRKLDKTIFNTVDASFNDLLSEKSIFRIGAVWGQNVAGGGIGYQDGNAIVKGYSYAAWNAGTDIDRLSITGVEGKINSWGTQFYAQQREKKSKGQEDMTVYGGGIGQSIGNGWDLWITGSGSKPQQYYSQIQSQANQIDLTSVKSAYDAYITAKQNGSKDVNVKLSEVSKALNNVFNSTGQYSPLQALANGDATEVSIVLKNKDNVGGILTLSSVQDQAGKNTTYMSTYLDVTKNVAIVGTLDLKSPMDNLKLGNSQGKVIGGLVTVGNFRALALVERVPPEVSPKEWLVHAGVGMTTKDMNAMLSGYTSGDNLYHIQLNLEGRQFDGAFVYKKV
ncbi:MAG TPA: hypothetical protein PLO51_05465, partial [Candidatus Micrarchaeota archaeon]|nr:hypothetical protein [Candidatus Micrarchaeota archaeon]